MTRHDSGLKMADSRVVAGGVTGTFADDLAGGGPLALGTGGLSLGSVVEPVRAGLLVVGQREMKKQMRLGGAMGVLKTVRLCGLRQSFSVWLVK